MCVLMKDRGKSPIGRNGYRFVEKQEGKENPGRYWHYDATGVVNPLSPVVDS